MSTVEREHDMMTPPMQAAPFSRSLGRAVMVDSLRHADMPDGAQTTQLNAVQQARMVAALRRSLRTPAGDAQLPLIETHISYVLLTGDMAYKIRKAVDLGFVDFTTLARRRHDCDEELRLNRRLAPELYLDVVPVTGTVDEPALGGTGPVLDWALRMRAFAQEGLWVHLAERGALEPQHIDALAQVLCRFHRDAEVEATGGAFGRAGPVRAPVCDTLRALEELCTGPDERAWHGMLSRWETQAFETLSDTFFDRQRTGRVRECHGDLHLGNVTQVDGRTTVFDCLEFDRALRWSDVMSDVAFMAMDLHAHELHGLANRFVNAYIEGSGDVDGLRVLRYYAVYRALVRAKVAAMRAADHADAADERRRYLGTALGLRRPAAPVLMLTHGCSGSGKTLLTQSLLEQCGAIRLRADVERKRLFGLPALSRCAPDSKARLYSAEASEATYVRLRQKAELALSCGYPVILDATFLQPDERRRARAVAEAAQANFVIIDFQASETTLRERVRWRAQRADDASDADLAVLDEQLARRQPLRDDERSLVFVFDAEPEYDAATVAERWAALRRRLGHRVS